MASPKNLTLKINWKFDPDIPFFALFIILQNKEIFLCLRPKHAQTCTNISTTFQKWWKSVNRVQNEFYMGRHIASKKHTKTNPWNAFMSKKRRMEKENTASLPASSDVAKGRLVLPQYAHDEKFRKEYNTLTPEEKKTIVEEYDKEKAMKAKGLRISSRAKINDVTSTLGALETAVRVA
ncbi:hypothetical protein F5887DRAFT_924647 [Amanita rubescens]|nr:hypothetical protein F5887DRAFT_924647 [Amanita rubescens]